MALFTKLQSVGSLKELISSIFLTKTNKANKVADNGVLNALFYGNAKVAQKAIKDIANIESELFIQESSGDSLDRIAQNNGVPTRFGATPSSTYVRLVADSGTIYTVGSSKFYSNQLLFQLQEDVTIGDNGFAYAKVVSTQAGSFSNVNAGSINRVDPIPTGHQAVFNEYNATGGRDQESDTVFRNRIINSTNLLAKGTKEMLLQHMIATNPNILRIWFFGQNNFGQQRIIIATQNGASLTAEELDFLYENIKDKLLISDSYLMNDDYKNVSLENAEYEDIDISMRIDRDKSLNADDIRKDMQVAIQKILDHRFWKLGTKLEWEDIYIACRGVNGVNFIPSNYFYPTFDIQTDRFKLPRIKGFEIRDIDGTIISTNNDVISPLYYPNDPDYIFKQTFNS